MGGAVAMSSTAITIRQLADQGELGARHGRVSVGTLLFQDLATLPFLVLVAALGVDAHGGHEGDGEPPRVCRRRFRLGYAASFMASICAW